MSMSRTRTRVGVLVVMGWVLFLGSLLLPAVRIRVPEILGFAVNIDETLAGWQIAASTVSAFRELGDSPGTNLMFLAGLGNLALLLSPLCGVSRRGLLSYFLGVFMIVAVASGLFVVSQFGFGVVRVGCLAWVVSHVLVMAGLVAQNRSRRSTAAVA